MSDSDEVRRSVTHEPVRYPVVTEKGIIKLCPAEGNVGGALILYEGEVRVSLSHDKRGWVLLRDLYEEEGHLDHFEIYEDSRRAKRAGAVVKAFPDELLPAEVLRRRAGQVPGQKVWEPPAGAVAAAKAARETATDEPAPPHRRGPKGT